jgi:hypothetical protein
MNMRGWRRGRAWARLRARLRVPMDDRGMSTVEYALGTLAAAAFAVVLMKILTGDAVAARLSAIIERALSGAF